MREVYLVVVVDVVVVGVGVAVYAHAKVAGTAKAHFAGYTGRYKGAVAAGVVAYCSGHC